MERVTRQTVPARRAAYLRPKSSLEALVDQADAEVLADVPARIGVADVRAFGLTRDDCGEPLHRRVSRRASK